MVNTVSIKDMEALIATDPAYWTPPTWLTSSTKAGSGSSHLKTPSKDLTRACIINGLVQNGYWVKATGSRVTQDGWTTYSDWDYVVFDPDVKLMDKLMTQGWMDGGSGGLDRSFASLRLGEVNLILVKEEDQWKKWIIATNMIKALNSKTKEERIKVFDGVFGKDKNAEAVTF